MASSPSFSTSFKHLPIIPFVTQNEQNDLPFNHEKNKPRTYDAQTSSPRHRYCPTKGSQTRRDGCGFLRPRLYQDVRERHFVRCMNTKLDRASPSPHAHWMVRGFCFWCLFPFRCCPFFHVLGVPSTWRMRACAWGRCVRTDTVPQPP